MDNRVGYKILYKPTKKKYFVVQKSAYLGYLCSHPDYCFQNNQNPHLVLAVESSSKATKHTIRTKILTQLEFKNIKHIKMPQT